MHPDIRDASAGLELKRLYATDALALVPRVATGPPDRVFGDPLRNIGYDYVIDDDGRETQAYLNPTMTWNRNVARTLQPDDTFRLAPGDGNAARWKIVYRHAWELSSRSWALWHWTFGVHCTRMINRSHAHLIYSVKDPKRFSFNKPTRHSSRLRKWLTLADYLIFIYGSRAPFWTIAQPQFPYQATGISRFQNTIKPIDHPTIAIVPRMIRLRTGQMPSRIDSTGR